MVITKRGIRLILVVGSIVGIINFLWLVRSGLYPFIIALFLAYLLNPAVCYLEKKGLKRLSAIILLYLVLFGVLIIGASRLLPLLVVELESFSNELPHMVNNIQELMQLFQRQYQNSALPYSLRLALDNALLALETEVQLFTANMVDGIINIVNHAVGLAISPILAFYLLHDWCMIKEELLLLLPGRWRPEIVLAFKDADKVLGGVIRGQVIVALIVGTLVTGGLYFLNVSFALIIGILAGMLDVIPYFGAFIGATPAVTLALLESPWLAAKVAILFFMIHQLEGTVISPKIIGENVGLHPLSVIFFVFVGGEIGGLTGMLLGVPVAAIAKVFISHVIKVLV
ncbi:MAG TPA: AI-2E family transporter [Negativicutes bacterium]